jgi:hypothetical protein
MPHGAFPREPREPTNHRWLHDTDRIRFVGPGYDPHNDVGAQGTRERLTWSEAVPRASDQSSEVMPGA